MRDFVVRMRKDTSLKFASPVVKGLSIASQPLMNWKNRQYATHRRDFERAALRVADEPPPVEVKMPDAKRGLIGGGLNGEDLNALRALAEQYQSRMKNPDLEVPAGQRARYEAAFARFSSIFPDTFYVRERGRFYPDDTEDKGRLLSAGFHNVMGYFRDDAPLSELLLDEKGQKELEALWDEFEFVAGYTARTYIEFFFNQSGEVLGNGRESGSHRPADKDITEESVILDFKKAYLAKAAADDDEQSRRVRGDRRSLRSRERGDSRQSSASGSKPSRASSTRCWHLPRARIAGPLTQAERDDLRGFYRSLREKSSLTHEEAMRDLIVNVLMSPHFSYLVAGAPRPAPVASLAGPRRPAPLRDLLTRTIAPTAVGSCAGQQAELLPLVEHARRRAVGPRGRRRSAQRIGVARPGPQDAEGRARAPPGHRVRRQLARLPPLRRAQRGRSRALSRVQQRAARRDVPGADPVHQRCRPQRPLGARHAVRQLHVRQSRAGEALWDARR